MRILKDILNWIAYELAKLHYVGLMFVELDGLRKETTYPLSVKLEKKWSIDYTVLANWIIRPLQSVAEVVAVT